MGVCVRTAWMTGLLAALALGLGGGCGGSGPSGPPGDPPPGQPPPGAPPPPPAPCAGAGFTDGFEAGLGAWETGFDLPMDPNNPGEVVAWSIAASGERAAEGSLSARFYLDGRQDDGTIWIVRTLDAPPDQDVVVRLDFALWSESESFNDLAVVVAYAGVAPPAVEADFDLTRRANQVAGWAPYAYRLPVRTDARGRIHVALGISAVWETEMVYFVDAVQACLE